MAGQVFQTRFMTQPSLPEPSADPSRQPWVVDTFRGLAILEVVIHHATGMALRYLDSGSPLHTAVLVTNRLLHFAVPAFLFVAAVLLTRSLLRAPDWGRYWQRRVTRGAWPYLLWSALYLLWYVSLGQRPQEVLTDPQKVQFYLLYGKSSYHMYFLLVALQAYFLIPLLLPLARARLSLWTALGVGLLLQLAVYFLNLHVFRWLYPGSVVVWYTLPLVLGVAVAARSSEFPAWFQRYRWWLTALLLGSAGAYLPLAVMSMQGQRVNGLHYNVSAWLFTSLCAVIIYGLCLHWTRWAVPFRNLVAWFGLVSLQVYLLHPALLQLAEKWWPPTGDEWHRTGVTLLSGYLVLVISALLGHLLLRAAPLSRFLFGR